MRPEVIVAVCALFVSGVSLATSIYFGWCTRQHNRRSVNPLPFLQQRDYEDHVAVVVQNNGTGPMILRRAVARNSKGASGHLIDLIPSPPAGLYFRNFNKVQQVRAVRPGDDVDLLVLAVDLARAEQVAYRDALRHALGDMEVELNYTDIYGTRFADYVVRMDWFHRHLR